MTLEQRVRRRGASRRRRLDRAMRAHGGARIDFFVTRDRNEVICPKGRGV
jgi:hypothetical protein